LLNWEPKVPLEQGVKVMLQYIEDWKDAPVWNPETIADATKSWFDFLSVPSKERNES
jgi:UDP-glucose 4-epimerase